MNNTDPSNIFYPVMEHFYTLQGEGCFAGYAAYFIRLGGCDVGCTWCDVKDSWDFEVHPKYSLAELEKWVVKSGTNRVVITGGEPTLYDLTSITNCLQNLNVYTHIETSGTQPLTGSWDWICFSPKRFKKPLNEYFEICNELKIIVAHKNDLRWAIELEEKTHYSAHLIVQPEWSVREEITPYILDFIKQHPKWHLSLQTHKYLDIP